MKCRDPLGPGNLLEFECPACGGKGCRECGNEGRFALTTCPLEYVDAEIWEMMDYAELYEKGLPPIAGGALDQAKVFIEACHFVWREQAHWEAQVNG